MLKRLVKSSAVCSNVYQKLKTLIEKVIDICALLFLSTVLLTIILYNNTLKIISWLGDLMTSPCYLLKVNGYIFRVDV